MFCFSVSVRKIMEVSISDLLNEGKKFLSDEKYNKAIMQFQKINELLNKGQIKDAGEMEIAETYFLYGKSLMLKYTYISSKYFNFKPVPGIHPSAFSLARFLPIKMF